MGLFSSDQFPVDGRTVLITGGSRGLGRSAARQLSEKGASVIIVARDIDKLKESIEYISEAARSKAQRFHYISADVSRADECSRVITDATKWNGKPLDIVWCVAGSCHPTLFVDTPIEQFQTMMDSNYFSCVYMAHAALNVWLRESETGVSSGATVAPSTQTGGPAARHLIFTASLISFYTFIGWAPYSPAKAAIRSLSDALSQEMQLYAAARPWAPAVRVHTVYPATMPTESLAAENRVKTDVTKMLEEGDSMLTPDAVARAAIAGLEAGHETVATSFLIRLVGSAMLGCSVRGGFWRGLADTLLGWVVMIVMVFVRADMDAKVRKWGKLHGPSGMKTKS